MLDFTHIFTIVLQSFKNAVIITSFVLTMMLIIEFVNIQTKGTWSKIFTRSKWTQIIFASLLGITPGCLGAYTVVSLYTHGIFNLAALVAAMIATFGDEAFILFSILPQAAVYITVSTFALAIIVGFIINYIIRNKPQQNINEFHLEIHNENINCCESNVHGVIKHFRKISFHRAVFIFGLLLVLVGMFSGMLGHNHSDKFLNLTNVQINKVEQTQTQINHFDVNIHHEHKENIDWIKITFVIITLITIVIISVVNEHFLKKHLWGHIIKKHFLKIFLWTFATLVVINIMLNIFNFDSWIKSNQLIILLIALLIGIIPISGPHIMFISLFASGSIPFSILLASSVVQDGHGSLPLLAESKKSFLIVKAINVLTGLLVGMTGYYLHW